MNKENKITKEIKLFIFGVEAIGTVDMILILVVFIGLVIIFKSQLTSLVNTLFENISGDAKRI